MNGVAQQPGAETEAVQDRTGNNKQNSAGKDIERVEDEE